MENRPDFSNYLVHFTKGDPPCNKAPQNPTSKYAHKSASGRLLSILESKTIVSSMQPCFQKKAVCFTECIWSSLLSHAERYSCYGIGFTKEFIFRNGGNPVFYVRLPLSRTLSNINWKVKPFITKFNPTYSNDKGDIVDFTHEREWRVPSDLKFEYSDIEFIVVKELKDIDDILLVAEELDIEKIIVMDNYKKIEQLWPTHKMNNSISKI